MWRAVLSGIQGFADLMDAADTVTSGEVRILHSTPLSTHTVGLRALTFSPSDTRYMLAQAMWIWPCVRGTSEQEASRYKVSALLISSAPADAPTASTTETLVRF